MYYLYQGTAETPVSFLWHLVPRTKLTNWRKFRGEQTALEKGPFFSYCKPLVRIFFGFWCNGIFSVIMIRKVVRTIRANGAWKTVVEGGHTRELHFRFLGACFIILWAKAMRGWGIALSTTINHKSKGYSSVREYRLCMRKISGWTLIRAETQSSTWVNTNVWLRFALHRV